MPRLDETRAVGGAPEPARATTLERPYVLLSCATRFTSAAVTGVWKARLARMAAFAAASNPSTSAVGSASAYPSAVASSSASENPAPVSSMDERMKLVVPLTMPVTRVMRSPCSDSRRGRSSGMAPATEAS